MEEENLFVPSAKCIGSPASRYVGTEIMPPPPAMASMNDAKNTPMTTMTTICTVRSCTPILYLSFDCKLQHVGHAAFFVCRRNQIRFLFERFFPVSHCDADARKVEHGRIVAAVADGHDLLARDAEFLHSAASAMPLLVFGFMTSRST